MDVLSKVVACTEEGRWPRALTPVRRPGTQGAEEIWRVELAGSKRTLLRAVPLPEVSSITAGIAVSVTRDGKNYAYQYSRRISTEYVLEGLR